MSNLEFKSGSDQKSEEKRERYLNTWFNFLKQVNLAHSKGEIFIFEPKSELKGKSDTIFVIRASN